MASSRSEHDESMGIQKVSKGIFCHFLLIDLVSENFRKKSLELFLGNSRGDTKSRHEKQESWNRKIWRCVCFLWKELENEVDNLGKIGVEHQLEYYRTCWVEMMPAASRGNGDLTA